MHPGTYSTTETQKSRSELREGAALPSRQETKTEYSGKIMFNLCGRERSLEGKTWNAVHSFLVIKQIVLRSRVFS